jgi:hypothetical protein
MLLTTIFGLRPILTLDEMRQVCFVPFHMLWLTCDVEPRRRRRRALVVRSTEPRDHADRAARFEQLRQRYEAEQAEIAALGRPFCGKYWFRDRWYDQREMRAIRGLRPAAVVDDDSDEEII